MMRGLIVIAGILGMVASTAMGAATITLTGPGGVSTYVPAPGATFEVTVSITSDYPMGSWGMTMTRPTGFGNLAALTSARSYSNGSYIDDGGTPEDPEDDVTIYTNSSGWAVDTGSTVGWVANTANGQIVLGDVFGDAPATNGFAAKVRITAPANPALIQGQIGGLLDFTTYVGNMTGTTELPTVVPLNLPEPVSALLLLAGLPMLRRRR